MIRIAKLLSEWFKSKGFKKSLYVNGTDPNTFFFCLINNYSILSVIWNSIWLLKKKKWGQHQYWSELFVSVWIFWHQIDVKINWYQYWIGTNQPDPKFNLDQGELWASPHV